MVIFKWAAIYKQLVPYLLNIELGSLERVCVSTDWKITVGCFSVHGLNSYYFFRFVYTGHLVMKWISSSTLLTQSRQKRSLAGIVIGRINLPFLVFLVL